MAQSVNIIQTLVLLVGKAYKMAHKRMPSDDELVAEASNLANSLTSIPPTQIQACYEFARLHYDDIPTARLVMKAWDKEIKKERLSQSPEEFPLITHQPRPDECWRDLVAARSLGYAPYPTDWIIRMLSQAPTRIEVETFCKMVREACRKIPDIIDLKAKNNPYQLTAEQIRAGLPAIEGNKSPIHYREGLTA